MRKKFCSSMDRLTYHQPSVLSHSREHLHPGIVSPNR